MDIEGTDLNPQEDDKQMSKLVVNAEHFLLLYPEEEELILSCHVKEGHPSKSLTKLNLKMIIHKDRHYIDTNHYIGISTSS